MAARPEKKEIRTLLYSRFSEIELRELCDLLGEHSYSQFNGSGPREKSFEIVDYFDHRLSLNRLWDAMVSMRPDLGSDTRTQTKMLLEEYLKSQMQEYETINFNGYVQGVPLAANLEDIFIDMEFSRPIPLPSVVFGVSSQHILEQQPFISWKEYIQPGNSFILLGPIGSGKTCFLNMLFLKEAGRTLNSLDQSDANFLIPIFLSPYNFLEMEPTNEWAFSEKIIALIENYFGGEIKYSQLKPYFSSLLILCDGLDEIPELLRRGIVGALKRLKNDHPGMTTVITMRSDEFSPDLFDPRGNYLLSTIKPFNTTSQDSLVRALFNVIQLQPDYDAGLLSKVAEIVFASGMNMVKNRPLYLITGTLISLGIYHKVSREVALTLIRRRIIELALEDWDRIKMLQSGKLTGNNEELKPLELACFLAYEAYSAASEQGVDVTTIEVPIETAAQKLYDMDLSQSKGRAIRVLAALMMRLSRRSEIFDCTLPSLSQVYRFKNSSDVVIMTALYLANQMTATVREQILENRLLSANWSPVIQIVFNLLSYERENDANRFIDFLLGKGEPPFIIEYTNRLLLSARCVLRVNRNTLSCEQKVIKAIVEILSDKTQTVNLQQRIQLAEALGDLGDPRIGSVVNIHEGEFWMGYDLFPNDRPCLRRRLPEYQIDAYPVTNAQYAQFIEDGGYEKEQYWDIEGWQWIQATARRMPRYWKNARYNKPNYPVAGVSWFEADAYARWAGKRLPTEQEWEKAARGEQAYYWPWGTTFNEQNSNCSDSEDKINGTTPIGIYPAGQSPFGVYDMAGNVSEWIADWYDRYDPRSPDDNHYGQCFKVRRGGGWGWDQDFARCTCRNASPRTADYAVNGFRCVSK